MTPLLCILALVTATALPGNGPKATPLDEEDVGLLHISRTPRPHVSRADEPAHGGSLLQLPSTARSQASEEQGILADTCDWGQRWSLAAFAPLNPHPTDEGAHERLGCCATTLAQVLYFHRRCPTGSVEYTVPGFEPTGMDFDQEASEHGLCDWSRFLGQPSNTTVDASTSAVARYIYATALVVERKWGSVRGMPHYLLDHEPQDREVERHYGVNVSRFHLEKTMRGRVEAKHRLMEELDQNRPVIAFLVWHGFDGHLVVFDGYRKEGKKLHIHLNAGQNGFNNGWYDFDSTFCFTRHKNGTLPERGHCATRYDHVSYLKFVRPRAQLGHKKFEASEYRSELSP